MIRWGGAGGDQTNLIVHDMRPRYDYQTNYSIRRATPGTTIAYLCWILPYIPVSRIIMHFFDRLDCATVCATRLDHLSFPEKTMENDKFAGTGECNSSILIPLG